MPTRGVPTQIPTAARPYNPLCAVCRFVFDELIENLKEIYHDLNSGEIPHVYHVGELEFA
ncbi:MAG: hypothetical protein PF693_03505 [Spirochaetia bacterium]|nr:hypothetical protein [Spirochaetia bacterium]